jgi:ABC-2 type transport system permease protein
MHDLANACWIELCKALRSPLPWFTLGGFSLLPLATAFLMFVYKNPALSRSLGLISVKANLAGGSADWPFFFSLYAQGVAIAGMMLFSIVITWVFGREFSDGTLKDLLAVPLPRGAILAGKFILAALWCLTLVILVTLLGLLLGGLIGLQDWSPALLGAGLKAIAVATLLVLAISPPVAFFASLGRGYLLPVGVTLVLLLLANLAAFAGWGAFFPWSVPFLYAEAAGKPGALEPASIPLTLLTGVLGLLVTYTWWKTADQNR